MATSTGYWHNLTREQYQALPHDSHSANIMGAGFTLNGVTIIIICLRLYTRGIITGNLGYDDLFMALALPFYVGGIVGESIIQAVARPGRHIWDTSLEDAKATYEYAFARSSMYYATLAIVRTSILCSYLRLFSSIDRLRQITIVTLAINAAMGISFIVSFFLQCRPLRYAWEVVRGPDDWEKCFDRAAFILVSSILGILMDFWILFLPMPALFRLNLPRSQKIVTALLLSVGSVSCIASIIRLKELRGTLSATTNADPIYQSLGYAVMTILEENLAAIAANVPPLKALVRKCFPRFLEGTRRSKTEDVEDAQLRQSSKMASRSGKCPSNYTYNSQHSPESQLRDMEEP